jgi:type II secretory pathway pseudopilin PulG
MQARSADDGFSLVEVLVALGLAMTVLVAVLPQLVVGIRAAGLATVMTEAKGVIQGHFEKMRSLPYHVAAVRRTSDRRPRHLFSEPDRSQ